MSDAMATTTEPGGEPARPPEELREQIVAALRNIYDPEIPVNIYDLGLIYSCGPIRSG